MRPLFHSRSRMRLAFAPTLPRLQQLSSPSPLRRSSRIARTHRSPGPTLARTTRPSRVVRPLDAQRPLSSNAPLFRSTRAVEWPSNLSWVAAASLALAVAAAAASLSLSPYIYGPVSPLRAQRHSLAVAWRLRLRPCLPRASAGCRLLCTYRSLAVVSRVRSCATDLIRRDRIHGLLTLYGSTITIKKAQ